MELLFHNYKYLTNQLIRKFNSLGIAVVPRETEDKAYVNFLGQTRCIMGDVQVANRPVFICVLSGLAFQ